MTILITTCPNLPKVSSPLRYWFDRGERDVEEYFQELPTILTTAVQHAAHATQLLTDEYIAPMFLRAHNKASAALTVST